MSLADEAWRKHLFEYKVEYDKYIAEREEEEAHKAAMDQLKNARQERAEGKAGARRPPPSKSEPAAPAAEPESVIEPIVEPVGGFQVDSKDHQSVPGSVGVRARAGDNNGDDTDSDVEDVGVVNARGGVEEAKGSKKHVSVLSPSRGSPTGAAAEAPSSPTRSAVAVDAIPTEKSPVSTPTKAVVLSSVTSIKPADQKVSGSSSSGGDRGGKADKEVGALAPAGDVDESGTGTNLFDWMSPALCGAPLTMSPTTKEVPKDRGSGDNEDKAREKEDKVRDEDLGGAAFLLSSLFMFSTASPEKPKVHDTSINHPEDGDAESTHEGVHAD